MRVLCKTEADTEKLGAALVKALPVPGFVALYGDLGAGKTALTRGMGGALGCQEVTSPTFTLVHEYKTDPPLIHFDAYRLSGGEALYEIGFDDYRNARAILVMEWAELVEDALPEERLEIRLTGSGEEPRTLELTPHGAAYERTVAALCKSLR